MVSLGVVRRRRWLSGAAAIVALGLFQGCASSRKPPLPKRASIEDVSKPPSSTDFAAMVAEADVIYFPDDRAGSGAHSEPAALLLEALQQSGRPMAIGWDLIDDSQQLLLDELSARPNEQREELINRLELVGSGRAREHCRAVLRDTAPGVRQLALRCPAELIVKFVSGERPTAEETKLLPRGFRAPSGGLEAYAEQLSSRRGGGLSNESLAGSYRAQMLSQQFVAERIVHHFRMVGVGHKLLVFVGRSDLEEGRGVPTYVAQKMRLRQLVLGSDARKPAPPKLLTEL